MSIEAPIDTGVEIRSRHLPLQRRLRLPALGLAYSERKLLLGIVDLLIVYGALAASLALRHGLRITRWEPTVVPAYQQVVWFVAVTVLWLLVASALDVYSLPRAANGAKSVASACTTALIVSMVYFFIPYLTPSLPVRRLEALAFPLAAVAGVGVWRATYAWLLVQPTFHQRALVIGAGWAGRTLAQIVRDAGLGSTRSANGPGYEIVGFVDDDPEKQGAAVEGVPVLGSREGLVDLVRRLRPDELVVAITHPDAIDAGLFQAILDVREMGVAVTSMAEVCERVAGRIPVEHAGRNLYIVLPMSQPATHRFYLALKRGIDLAIGLAGCAALGPVTLAIWLANRLTSPGPVFYRQTRVGKGGREFTIVKYRSMVVDAESRTGAVWASTNDSRITPVGKILRRLRFDELPQVWNILKGEMSLIGPRPERPEFVEQLARELPFYRVRHAVKPGLTGWAQVQYRYGASLEDSLIKLEYDLYYIKRQGPVLDLEIVAKTFAVVLRLQGR